MITQQDLDFARSPLRAAIAETPSSCAYFARERQRLYDVLGIPTNDEGEPVYRDGRPIIRDVHEVTVTTADVAPDVTEPPAGYLSRKGLADRYNVPAELIARYLYLWRHEWPEPIAGYFRQDRKSQKGFIARPYYDPEEFDEYLRALQDAGEQGARRLLTRGKFRPKRGAAGLVRGRK